MIHVCRATTAAEREAVYHFRYVVYVEELGRYAATADHVHKRLVDPEDARSWQFYAHDGSEVIASYRITPGSRGFSARQIDQYGLRPFLAELPERVLFVGERTMVAAAHRGTSAMAQVAAGAVLPVPDEDLCITFGACEPHLIPYYADLDTLPYAATNVNSEESGYLIPLVSFPNGSEALDGLGPEPGTPRCIQRVLDGESAVSTESIDGAAGYEHELDAAVGALRSGPDSFFHGLTDAEIRRCTERSSIVTCAPGDRVVRRGGSARNVYVVLDGTVEPRDDGRAMDRLGPGSPFGAMSFLADQPRGRDVVVIDRSTRVLSLSAKVLRDIIGREPVLAAKLLANLDRSFQARGLAPLADAPAWSGAA